MNYERTQEQALPPVYHDRLAKAIATLVRDPNFWGSGTFDVGRAFRHVALKSGIYDLDRLQEWVDDYLQHVMGQRMTAQELRAVDALLAAVGRRQHGKTAKLTLSRPGGGHRIAMVTIGTDGNVDYVQVPNGQRYNLGPVSVLKLIRGVASHRTVRAALDEFLQNKQVMLTVDLDKMWSLLPFHRARFSSTANPLMHQLDCEGVVDPPRENSSMKQGNEMENLYASTWKTAVENLVSQIEYELHLLQKGANKPEDMVANIENLQKLIAAIRTPPPYGDQATNKPAYSRDRIPGRYAGKVPPQFLEQQEKMKEKSEDKDDKESKKAGKVPPQFLEQQEKMKAKSEDKDDKEDKKASLTEHLDLAEEIVAKVATTDKAIDRLVAAGRRFNSVRAKADLHKIASRVAEISGEEDLAQPWVGSDLVVLANQTDEIHDLFVSKV